MNNFEYNKETNNYIRGHLTEFYATMYKDSEIKPLSNGSFRLEPCPICGHHDCCTVSPKGVKCFSCDDFKGGHVAAYIYYAAQKLGFKEPQAREILTGFSHIELPNMSPQEKIEYEKFKRTQQILSIAEDYYYKQLLTCKQSYLCPADKKVYSPLDYMLKVRRRAMQTIEDFKIGFVNNRTGLDNLLYKKGFTKDEIKDSRVWCFEDLYIFYYHDPESGYITRFNTKNPFEIRKREYSKDGTYIEGDVIKGMSSYNKTFYYTPNFTFEAPFIMVEGEHDLYALYEQGFTNVCCAGGNLVGDDDRQVEPLEKAQSTIYTCFDNDSAGVKYTQFCNDFFCDKEVKRIKFDMSFNDIDEYYRDAAHPIPVQTLLESAEILETEKSKIREKRGTEWSIATRSMKIVFVVKKRSDSAGITGDITCYEGDVPMELYSGKALAKLPKKYRALAIDLQQEIDRYYNRGIYSLGFDELVKMHRFSVRKQEIERRLAELMSQDKDLENHIGKINKILGASSATSDFIDELMKVRSSMKAESNGINASSIIPIKLAETFDVVSGYGYIYFNYHKVDAADGTMKRLPFLLRSDGYLIRLDLYKRNDPNSVLLIDGKFELPYEVPTAITTDESVSLKDYWAEKFIAAEVPQEELDPGYLIKRVEKYVEKFYFFADKRCYKVIALYIVMTYFYECFSSIPYLYLNGEKGSGKSTLGSIIAAFSFNAKMSISISSSALFRTVAIEGGTFVIDELENMTSRAKSQESDFGALLKGGYFKEGRIFRTNTDNGNKTESFNAFGPKVLSNIFGLDDVIEDRCITVRIPKVNIAKDEQKRYQSIVDWKAKNQAEMEEVTSKLALCALTYFKKVVDTYHNIYVDASSSRLSQILKPMVTIARVCDQQEINSQLLASPQLKDTDVMGLYEKTFLDYCDDVLSFLKESTEKNTPEGIIKAAIYGISREVLGLTAPEEREFTRPEFHKYSAPIKYFPDDFAFEINDLHIKVFVEEAIPENTSYTLKNFKTMMNIFNIKKTDIAKRYVPVTDMELVKDLNNTKRPRMSVYVIRIADVYPELIVEKQRAQKTISDDIEETLSSSEEAF